MAYCTIADVQRSAGGRSKLQQLTDTDAAGQVDEDYLDTVIADAQSMIDSYLQHRYAVPIPDVQVPEVIRNVCAREVVYILKERREALTADDQLRHDNRIGWLNAVNQGQISPGVDPRLTKSSSVVPTTGDRSNSDRTLTRDRFGGWT